MTKLMIKRGLDPPTAQHLQLLESLLPYTNKKCVLDYEEGNAFFLAASLSQRWYNHVCSICHLDIQFFYIKNRTTAPLLSRTEVVKLKPVRILGHHTEQNHITQEKRITVTKICILEKNYLSSFSSIYPKLFQLGYLTMSYDSLPLLLVHHSYKQIERVRNDVRFTTPCIQVGEDLVQEVGDRPLASVRVTSKRSGQGKAHLSTPGTSKGKAHLSTPGTSKGKAHLSTPGTTGVKLMNRFLIGLHFL